MYDVEVTVVSQFVAAVASRLRPEAPGPAADPDDPFALWEQGFAAVGEAEEERDPLLDRLFPQVHPHDERASAEHRRLSEPELRQQKAAEADVVLAALADARPVQRRRQGRRDAEDVLEVVVPDADLDAWLRTTNAARLALALELDITTAEDADALAEMDEDDERVYAFSVYEFLGELQGVLLALRGYE